MGDTGDAPSATNGVTSRLALSGQRALAAVALILIVGVALGLRLYGLDWDRGYDYTPHPDERAILGKVGELSLPSVGELGLLFTADSPWNPGWFPYGSFPLYLLKGVQLAQSAWTGVELHDLRVAGRALSSVADVGTVVLVYLLGNRIYGRRVGLLASALLALAVVHIQLSHFYTVDTLLGFFTVGALYFLYGVAKEGRLRDSVLAGVFVGLGLATKVSLAPILIAFGTAHLLFLFNFVSGGGRSYQGIGDRSRGAFMGLVAGTWAAVVVFVVAQPYTLLDWPRFYADVIEQSEMVRRIRDYPYTRQYIDTTPYWYHIRQLSTWGLGWPLGVAAWAGLLYASLWGMRLRYGLVYLALGWALPMSLLLLSTGFLMVLVASSLAAITLVATLPLRSAESRGTVLLLAWVAPYLIITGAFEVKFLRYMVPVTPVLVLLGSHMMMAGWARVGLYPPARRWVAAAVLLVVGVTGFYALSYMAMYGEPHTAVRTSQWINNSVPKGATLLKEHWEEGLPGLGGYEIRTLYLYDADGPGKLDRLSQDLAAAEYLVFFSNRLYGTIPRLPERYPITSKYYRLLFSGELGYELANAETAYPRLAGVTFRDDTFSRPGLPRSGALSSAQIPGIALNLGFADESFSVYDHPTGLVFKNVERKVAEEIRGTIMAAVDQPAQSPGPAIGLLLSPEDAEAQRRGGTWSDIVRPQSWTIRMPILAWLLFVEGIALLALPTTLVLFRPLADRGYLFSKALGLLMVSLVVWLLASLHWLSFSRGSIVLALVLVGAVSAVVLLRNRNDMLDFVRRRWRFLLAVEFLFLAAFLCFVALRMANPDLWHPWRGGEKPMELAYLNAVLRSSYMPPYDPWFGGGYINYYYYGQFMVAVLVKAIGIEPTVAFNLAVPLFFALTVAGAFTVVYNLAEGTRRRGGFRWSPVMAGAGGALLVTVIGNMDGAIQLGHGAWRALVRSVPFGEFDFWRSSRMMPPDPPGWEITEFPYFTFLFADLHAHMLAMPFTVLALGLALAIVVGARHDISRTAHAVARLARDAWSIGELARVAILGVVVGGLRVMNAWDYPTYLLVAIVAVFLAEFLRNGGLGLLMLAAAGLKAVFVFAVGYLAFLPYHLSYEPFYTSLETTTNQTVLWQFLAISGLFIFIIGSFLVSESTEWLLPTWRAIHRWAFQLVGASSTGRDTAVPADERRRVRVMRLLVVVLVAAAVGYFVSSAVSGLLGSTIPFLLIMWALALVVGLRSLASFRDDTPELAFVVAIAGVSIAIAIGLDIYRVEADIDRQNSVFKFYLQIWVMLALASAYLLWRLSEGRWNITWLPGTGRKVWVGALVVLIVSASIYPVLGTRDRLRDRFEILPSTLDGMAYMRGAVYQDGKGPIDLSSDYDGIRWLLQNVEGSPTVLEGHTPEYRWGGRVSVYTGLPTVVGWANHQRQQRGEYAWAVDGRVRDVNRIYSTTDPTEALSLIRKYGVRYVYVGKLESLYYPCEGLAKFDGGLSEHLERVYQNGEVSVYRVRQG